MKPTRFKRKYIRQLYGSESESYQEDLRPRLIVNPVFEKARDYQELLLTSSAIDVSSGEKIYEQWSNLQSYVGELNEDAYSAGLLNRPVTLQGEGIRLPTLNLDLVQNFAHIALKNEHEQQEKMFEDNLDPQMYGGLFAGFSLRFASRDEIDSDSIISHDENDKDGTTIDEETSVPPNLYPQLIYRVSYGTSYTPNMDATLYATGDVGVTGLHFYEDDEIDARADQLAQLFAIGNQKTRQVINSLNMEVFKEQYDERTFSRVASYAERAVNMTSTQEQAVMQDKLLDYIDHFFGPSLTYQMETPVFSVRSLKDPELPEEFYLTQEGEELQTFTTQLSGILFRPKYANVNGTLLPSDKLQMEIAFSDEEKMYYVPASQLVCFIPID